MSVLSKEEFNNKLKGLIGDNTDDASLEIIEDFNDTFDSLTTSASDTEDWKSKYEENDKMWREKYKSRFFETGTPSTSSGEIKDDQFDDVDDDGEKKTYADLFEEREG